MCEGVCGEGFSGGCGGISAINANQIKVMFNKDLTTEEKVEALKIENYSVYNNGSTTAVADAKFDTPLMDGDNAVVLTIKDYADVLTNNVSNLKVVAEKKAFAGTADKTFENIEVKDYAKAEIEKVEVIAPNKLRVTFTEPVFNNNNGTQNRTIQPTAFKVDNGLIGVNSVDTNLAAATQYKVIDLMLTGNVTAGAHTIVANPSTVTAANKIIDAAGWDASNTAASFTYDSDAAAPVVTIKEATQTKVTLQFDEGIKNYDNSNVKYYYGIKGQANYEMTDGTYDSAKHTLELDVKAGSAIPAGSTSVYIVYTSPTGTVIEDMFANKMAEQTLAINVDSDTTKPTVSSVTYNTTTSKIDVVFSENVNTAEAQNVSNYTLTQNGTALTVASATYNTVTKTASLSAAITGGTCTMQVKNIHDLALTPNKMDDSAVVTFNVADSVSPLITDNSGATNNYYYGIDAAANGDTAKIFKIYFNEVMDSTKLADVTLYSATKAATGQFNPTTAVAAADGKSVVLTFSEAIKKDTLVVGALTDLAGNKLISKSTLSTTLTGQPAVEKVGVLTEKVGGVNVPKIHVTAKNQVKVYLNDIVTGLTKDDIVVDKDGGDNSYVAPASISVSTEDSKTVVTLVLGAGNEMALDQFDTTPLQVKTAASPAGQNASGVKIGFAASNAQDKMAPTLVSKETVDADTDGQIDHIKLTFSEKIAMSSVNKDQFTVEGYTVTDGFAGTVTTSATDRATTANAKTVYITVTEKTTPDTAATPKITVANTLTDVKGNAYAGLTTATASTDKAAPVITSWTADFNANGNDKNLVFNFSEPVTEANFDLSKVSIDDTTDDGSNVVIVGTKTQTDSDTITVKSLTAAKIEALNTEIAKTAGNHIGDVTTAMIELKLDAAAMTDAAANTSAVVAAAADFAPTTVVADTTKLGVTGISQTNATVFKVTLNDYISAADAVDESKWTPSGYTLNNANALDADGVSINMTADADIADTDTLTINGLTDLGSVAADTAADKGTAAGAGAAATWTID